MREKLRKTGEGRVEEKKREGERERGGVRE